jgi:hypothetical protein
MRFPLRVFFWTVHTTELHCISFRLPDRWLWLWCPVVNVDDPPVDNQWDVGNRIGPGGSKSNVCAMKYEVVSISFLFISSVVCGSLLKQAQTNTHQTRPKVWQRLVDHQTAEAN